MAGLASSLAGKTGTFQVPRQLFLSTLSIQHLRHPCPSLPELTITCQALVKKLGQVPAEQGSLSDPTTAAYVFNGAYIPLACRLTQEVQILCSTGETHLVPQVLRAGPNIAPTSNLGEALRLLPGETVHTQANTGADVPKVTSSIQLLMTAVTY